MDTHNKSLLSCAECGAVCTSANGQHVRKLQASRYRIEIPNFDRVFLQRHWQTWDAPSPDHCWSVNNQDGDRLSAQLEWDRYSIVYITLDQAFSRVELYKQQLLKAPAGEVYCDTEIRAIIASYSASVEEDRVIAWLSNRQSRIGILQQTLERINQILPNNELTIGVKSANSFTEALELCITIQPGTSWKVFEFEEAFNAFAKSLDSNDPIWTSRIEVRSSLDPELPLCFRVGFVFGSSLIDLLADDYEEE